MTEGFQVSISKDVATKTTTAPQRQSWWIEVSRQEFYAKVKENEPELRQTEFGQLRTRGTDSLSGGRPR